MGFDSGSTEPFSVTGGNFAFNGLLANLVYNRWPWQQFEEPGPSNITIGQITAIAAAYKKFNGVTDNSSAKVLDDVTDFVRNKKAPWRADTL